MLYRVSTEQLYLSSQSNMMNQTTNLNNLNHKIATGKEIEKSSDDPVLKQKIMHENKLLQESKTWKKNIDEATNQLQTTENTLQSVHETLSMVREITVAMANDTANANDRLQARQRVLNAMKDIVDYSNTQIDGFYIFGGYTTGTKPFLDDGTYNGDENTRKLEISTGVTKKIGFPGNEIFTGMKGGVQVGRNIFTTLQNLAEDLLNNNVEGVRSRIGEIDEGLEQVSKNQTESGILQQEVQITDSILETAKVESQTRKSKIEDLDLSTAMTNFQSLQLSLQATMSATSKVFEVSLLNYLR
jgi:flagellar hook-associated protein 3 FlgL